MTSCSRTLTAMTWVPPAELPSGTFRIDRTFRLAIVGAALLIDALALYVVAAADSGDRAGALAVLALPMVLLSTIAIAALVTRLDVDRTMLVKRRLHGTRSLATSAITSVSYTRARHQMNAFTVILHGDDVGSRIALDVRYWERTNDLVQLARALDPAHAPDPMSERLDAEVRWRAGERPGERRPGS